MTTDNSQYANNVSWFLDELSRYKPGDLEIEDGEFEVIGEDEQGREGSCSISIPQLAAEAKQLIDKQYQFIEEMHRLVHSECGDFCAGLGNPGEPETPDQISTELLKRIDMLFKHGCNKNDNNTSPQQ